MTQEEKDLLIKDLSCRLPYRVKVHAKYTDDLGETIEADGIVKMIDADGVVGIEVMYDTSSSFIGVDIDDVKLYLFPLSNMTEEQKREYNSLKLDLPTYYYEYGDIVEKIVFYDTPESFNYLIANRIGISPI